MKILLFILALTLTLTVPAYSKFGKIQHLDPNLKKGKNLRPSQTEGGVEGEGKPCSLYIKETQEAGIKLKAPASPKSQRNSDSAFLYLIPKNFSQPLLFSGRTINQTKFVNVSKLNLSPGTHCNN